MPREESVRRAAGEELMVGEDDIGGIAQERNAREHVVANLAVGAQDLLF